MDTFLGNKMKNEFVQVKTFLSGSLLKFYHSVSFHDHFFSYFVDLGSIIQILHCKI